MYISKNHPFSQTAIENAIEHCRSKLPEEAGGIFVDDEFIPYENVYNDKLESYAIGNSTDFNQLYIDNRVQCIIHSHDNKQFASPQDLSSQESFDIPFGIINFRNGGVQQVVFWGNDIESEPLNNRPFFFGVYDCMTLVRDYTLERTGVELYSPLRDFEYWKRDYAIFEETVNSSDYPVQLIDKSDVREHDYIFYKFDGSKVINHVGVVNAKGRVHHHFFGHKSMTLPISYYQEQVYCGGRLSV